MYLVKTSYKHMFNPLEVPIMDILAVDTEREFGWHYQSQANRGLARSMLWVYEVREIILNEDQAEDEQRRIIDWHHQQLAKTR